MPTYTPKQNQNTAALARSRSETAGAWYIDEYGNAMRRCMSSELLWRHKRMQKHAGGPQWKVAFEK